MKNKIIILIIAFGLFSCKKDKIYEKQIGKWEVYYHNRNWSLLYQDTFTMEVFQNRKLLIDKNTLQGITLLQDWPKEIYWMTSLDEKRLEFNYFDTLENDIVTLIRWKIVENTKKFQKWEWLQNTDSLYYKSMILNRLE